MSSLGTRLDRLEQRAGLAVADGPLGDVMVRGGQGRTPAQVARVALEHFLWRIGRNDTAAVAAMSDEEVCELLTRLRDRVFHPLDKKERA